MARRGIGTRERLIDAALATLNDHGFAGTTARAIAVAAGTNQALIYYHFGGVDRLLVAALEATSRDRLARYRVALSEAASLPELIAAMVGLYSEDVATGHVTAVQELVAGGSSVPGLRKEIVAQMEPWFAYAEEVLGRFLAGTPVETVLPIKEMALAGVAMYLGIETLTTLDGDRSKADALFDLAMRLAPLADSFLQSARP